MTAIRTRNTCFAALALALALVTPASADDGGSSERRATLAEIQATLGFVPGFLSAFPAEGITGAWMEFKAVMLDPKPAVPARYKELIALAVAAQVPCEYCVYFHTRAARAHGAKDAEIKEAVALAGVVRHWSAILNGSETDEAQFRHELGQVVDNLRNPSRQPAASAGRRSPITDARSARADIQRTLGMVPSFFGSVPDAALAGAWKEMKELPMNPRTAIPSRYKELLSLAVAAQIPCRYCVAFHRTISQKLLGASVLEVQEALSVAAIVRHWSTFLNGMQIDRESFRAEVDRIFGGARSAGQAAR